MDGRRRRDREDPPEQNPAYSPTRLPLPAVLPGKGPLTCVGGPFRSFGGLPCYAAESPSEVPQTGLKVPEKSLEGVGRGTGRSLVLAARRRGWECSDSLGLRRLEGLSYGTADAIAERVSGDIGERLGQ